MASEKYTKFGIELERLILKYVGSEEKFCLDYGIKSTTLYRWQTGGSELNLKKIAYLAEYFSSESSNIGTTVAPVFFVIRLVSNHDTILQVQEVFNKRTNARRSEKRRNDGQ